MITKNPLLTLSTLSPISNISNTNTYLSSLPIPLASTIINLHSPHSSPSHAFLLAYFIHHSISGYYHAVKSSRSLALSRLSISRSQYANSISFLLANKLITKQTSSSSSSSITPTHYPFYELSPLLK